MDIKCVSTCTYESPLGNILLAADEIGLTGLWFERQKYFANTLPEAHISQETPILTEAKQWLDRYFSGECPSPEELDLAPIGSPFQHSVWKLLCQIPYGEVVTYGDLAKTIAAQRGIERMAAQAIGGVVGRNPISIIIPCHRVVGANGNLTGYGGGIDKKIALLKLEGIDMKKYYIPRPKRSCIPN